MSDHEEIDPSWWAGVFDDETHSIGDVSVRLRDMLGDSALTPLQRRVLETLADVTSARLREREWLEPFAPTWSFGQQRSVLPSDMSPDQITLLADLVEHIRDPALRARVADVAWFYGDRSEVALADAAIDAYRAAELQPDSWMTQGREAWQRAFDLLARRGRDGAATRAAMCTRLSDRVLAATLDDAFAIADFARMLRANGKVESGVAEAIHAHLVELANLALAEPRLSRVLEEEAGHWTTELEQKAACQERAARTYIAEADARLSTADAGAAMAEGLLLERAIALLKRLPRRYRLAHGIDELLVNLRARLVESREGAIESMMRIETDPVDLTEAANAARARVSDAPDRDAALAMFALLQSPMDAEAAKESAASLVATSISRLFGSSTLGTDGRKVAFLDGSSDESEAAVWDQMIRTASIHAQLVAQGMVLPALEVLTLKYSFDTQEMQRICKESPLVPVGHDYLWAAGLTLGLNGEFGLAVAVVVPQLEQLVRMVVKSRGGHTLLVDDETGVESEKGLGALLDMPECADALGDGIVMEFKALLVEQRGPNLRNDIAHGLFNDIDGQTYAAVYAWWMCFRLVVWPWWIAMRADSDFGSPSK